MDLKSRQRFEDWFTLIMGYRYSAACWRVVWGARTVYGPLSVSERDLRAVEYYQGLDVLHGS